jgi:hypothetical protein
MLRNSIIFNDIRANSDSFNLTPMGSNPRPTRFAPRLEFGAGPSGITAHVKNRTNRNPALADQIVDREWEGLSEQSEKPEMFRMDPGVE